MSSFSAYLTKMEKNISIVTTKIPHHSRHSGYEQLINYLNHVEIKHVDRGHSKNQIGLTIERILRRFSASRWYQWDGVLGDLFALKKLKEPNAIVHFLYGDSMIGLWPYVHRLALGKMVLTIHATPSDLPEVIQYPYLLQEVDAFIVLGDNQKEFLLAHGVQPEKIHRIHHGVDTVFFKPIEFKPVLQELQIVMVGNWRRNFSLYQNMIQQTQNLPYVFHVVTPEFNHHWFRGLKNTKLYSGISDESLRAMYQFSDVMVMGVTDAVANNVLLEAASCGLPIICEDVGAVRDYFSRDAITYVNSNDVSAVIHLLQLLHQDRILLQSKAQRALQEVQNYSWIEIAKKTTSIYESL
jgi:glycosyltransferase involved in cell wall biosynthesis